MKLITREAQFQIIFCNPEYCLENRSTKNYYKYERANNIKKSIFFMVHEIDKYQITQQIQEQENI